MNNPTTIRDALLQASLLFKQEEILNPRLQAEVLLQHLLGWSKVKVLTEDLSPFPPEKLAVFQTMVTRRLAGEPLQYIVGVQEFYGRDFWVNPSVLIPRPETEFLIEEILKRRAWWKQAQDTPRIADIGTGSGAIAVTLALEWPSAEVYTVDLSADAIRTAQENASRLEARVQFLQGDLVNPLLERGVQLDVLVSNPPYIPSSDINELAVEVREHEPRLALDGGPDGLAPYRRITKALPRLMRENGPALVAFEVGIGQAEAVADMTRTNWPGAATHIVQDLQGIDRVVLAWCNTTADI